jgi:arylsulfatase A-like enzyme
MLLLESPLLVFPGILVRITVTRLITLCLDCPLSVLIRWTMICGMVLIPSLGRTQTTPPTNAPNVMVILFDDMGFSDLGCYGGEVRTPNIDTLATNGLRFRNFHNTARCSPTRISLLTGLYTHQAATVPGDSLPPLRTNNNVTVPEVLRSGGYRTYMAGKWHIGSGTGQTPRERGFQHVFGMGSTQAGAGADYWNRTGTTFSSEDNEIPTRQYGANAYDYYLSDAIGDYAVDFLNHHFSKGDGKKFFMYLPVHAPHFDIQVNKSLAETNPPGGQSYLNIYMQGWDIVRSNRYQQMRSSGVIDASYVLSPMSDTPYNGTTPYQAVPTWNSLSSSRQADLSRRMALYAAMIEQMDRNIGRIIDRLRTGGQLDNTLIFIVSDNGCNAEGGMYGWARTGTEASKSNNHAPLTGTDLAEMGQPFRDDKISIGGGWANVGNTPFRMYKRYSHEGGIRTPLIAHWPAGITNAGRWTDQLGHVIDLPRTILEVAGAAHPAQYNGHPVLPLEGASLVPIFGAQPEFDRTIGFEHESTRAWFDGPWKLVTKTADSTDGSSFADTIELYNIAADPTELTNLAPYLPNRLVAMVQDWNAWATRVGVPSSRLLPTAFNSTPAGYQADLFLDTYSRPDTEDIDVAASGMSGSRVPPLAADAAYVEGFEGSGLPDSIRIFTGRLQVAYGLGMAECGIAHNFIGQDIIDAGGFSVSIKINAISTATGDPSNRYLGFGVGLTQAEAAAGSDISGTKSFRGSVANPIGKADFFVELDIEGSVKVWRKGQLLDSSPVGTTNGTLTASFALNGFTTTSTVTVNVFFNGHQLDIDNGSTSSMSRTFTWENNNANYIGLSARATVYSEIDYLSIGKLPLAPTLASELALRTGLTAPESGLDADPDGDGDNNLVEWLKGGNPAVNDDSRQLLAVSSVVDGQFRFTFYQPVEGARSGVNYSFRCSPDLKNWTVFTPEDFSVFADAPGYQRVQCRVPTALTAGQQTVFVLLETGNMVP